MTKPTPGPTIPEPYPHGVSERLGITIGDGLSASPAVTFWENEPGQAKRNARAWVDGMAAMEMIAKIHAAYNDKTLDDEIFVIAVREILGESG